VDIGLVIGSEGRGLGQKIKEQCDFLVSIPQAGKVASLNASVSAGILIYEIMRQRGNVKP
jgi:23S rRNA (guanosine2251-2'-O)-methyltransferase